MALRGITLRRRHLLHVPRAFFCSNPPFPPPPPPANEGPDAADPLPSSPQSNPGAPPRGSASSLFQDIRERLRVSLRSPTPRRIPIDHSPKELPDVRQALESFRRSGGLNSSSSSSTPGASPSFTDLIKNQRPCTGQGLGGFDTIRQSLKGALPGPQSQRVQPAPFLSVNSDIFKKELERGGKDGKEEEKGSVTTLMKVYSYKDLGKRLGDLRPAGVVKDGKEWFSLEELQGRVAKLVELEKQEHRLGAQLKMIRDSIMQIKQPAKGVQGQGAHMQTMLVLGMQKTPEYMRLPPQEELVEKYFHPDHMSSEEKMKLELQRVRDEFKMSENDCGSARVQIAQLTLKIKYLSAVLHKKDKHSRKGLQEMVQKRKKYLKYLRRTDWDSYCLVLSKLGLRDVPEYKAPDYKSKPITKAKSKKNKSKKNKSKKKMKA